jgi:hypothetical protein
MSYVVAKRTERLVIATWRNIVMWVGGGEASAAEIRLLHKTLDHVPDKAALMLWLPDKAPLPDSEGRTAASRLFREGGPKITAFAVITEGGGFWASAVRSIVTGLNLAARSRFAFKSFDAIESATPWLLEKVEMLDDRAEFDRVTRELRDSVSSW